MLQTTKRLFNIDELSHCILSLIIVTLNNGVRKEEVLNLKWEDIDFHQKMIYLLNMKNNEKREKITIESILQNAY